MDLIKTFKPSISHELNSFFINKDEIVITKLKCSLVIESVDNCLLRSQKGNLYLCS